MGASNLLETGWLALLLTNTNLPNIGDATGLRGSTTAGVFYCSLTVSPGHTEGGDQSTNEAAYTNYAREDIPRDTSNWTVTDDVGTNDGTVTFPQCGVTGATIVGFGLGYASAGAGHLHIIGDLADPL